MQLWHHPQARSLLEAIHAQPEDDMVRLVFADWLEEHGLLARAEFIRVQCERARLPSWDRRALELTWRERDLLDEHGHLWFAEAPVLPGVFWAGFERGFLSHVHVPDLACLAGNAEILRLVPGLRVTVQQVRRDEVAPVPVLPSLRGLQFTHEYVPEDLTRLLVAPWTAPLTDLDLKEVNLDATPLEILCRTPSPMRPDRLALGIDSRRAEHVEWLFNAPWFEAVTCLWCRNTSSRDATDEGDEIERVIATMPAAGRLRELALLHHPISTKGLRTLLSAKSLSGLSQLHLPGLTRKCIDPDGLRGLPTRPNLRELRLESSGVLTEDVSAFLECNALANLHSLELVLHSSQPTQKISQSITWPANLQFLALQSENLAKPHFLALFANLPWASLHSLKLDSIPLPAKAVQQIAAGAAHGNLRVLSVQHCRLHGEALQSLIREGMRLWDLDLRGNHPGPAGMEALSRSPILSKTLRRLSLGDNSVSDSGLEALSRQHWCELRELNLPHCRLSDVAMEHLTNTAHFERLTRLNMPQNVFGREALKRLFTSHLMGRITHLGLNDSAREERSAEVLFVRPDLMRLRALGIRGFLKQPEECEQLARSSLPGTCGVNWNVHCGGSSVNLAARFPGSQWASQYFRDTET